MAVSIDRIKEVIEHYCLHGEQETCSVFNLNSESLNRYKRIYNQKVGAIKDTLVKIKEKFSEEELQHLLEMDKQKVNRYTDTITFDGEDFCFLALSDTHIGSTYFEEKLLMSALEEGNRQGCTALLHAGDILEGMSGRPGQLYELNRYGYSAQRDYAVELFKEWKKPMWFLTGNHTEWFNTKAGVGLDVGEDIAHRIPDAHFLGSHEGVLQVNGANIMLWHGEDGSSYATSYRISKIIEAFTGGEKPTILLLGHVHKMCYIFERNIHAVSLGSIELQSGFMRYKRLPAHTGFFILKGKIKGGEVKQFTPTWYPFYK